LLLLERLLEEFDCCEEVELKDEDGGVVA